MTLLINEVPLHSIYLATEGEGINIGHPQFFIRFQGCAIGCLNCDSKTTWKFDQSKNKSIKSVLDEINQINSTKKVPIKRVSITGGDPMDLRFRSSLKNLITELKLNKFWVNIEASGLDYDEVVFRNLDFISLDLKTPSTGVNFLPEVLLQTMENFSHKMQIKSVVADRRDFDFNLEVYKMLNQQNPISVSWVLTPSYETFEEFPQERFKNIIMWNETEGAFFRVIGQQHKWVFGAKASKV